MSFPGERRSVLDWWYSAVPTVEATEAVASAKIGV